MDTHDYEDFKPAVISAMIVADISLNLLVIAVIARYPQLREDRSTLFMFSLTLSDLAKGCTVMPVSAALCSSATPSVRNDTRYFPKIQAFFSVCNTVTSMNSLCWVTVCKMVAITNPLRYEQVLTRNRCYFIICSIWVTGTVAGATLVFSVESWNFAACMYRLTISKGNVALMFTAVLISIVFPIAGLVYSTMRILLAIFRTHRQIAAQVNSVGGEHRSLAVVPSLTLKSVRSGRNVLIICMALVVLTIPFVVFASMTLLGLTKYIPVWFSFVATWMLSSNSFINSLIYIFVFRSVRGRTAEMLRQLCQIN